MAIKDWSPGQLVVFWAAIVVAAVVAYAIWDPRGRSDITGARQFLFAAGGVVGLVVTWKWFGARKKRGEDADR